MRMEARNGTGHSEGNAMSRIATATPGTVAGTPATAATAEAGAVEPAAISVRGLVKRYGAVTALDGLDLAVPAGAVFEGRRLGWHAATAWHRPGADGAPGGAPPRRALLLARSRRPARSAAHHGTAARHGHGLLFHAHPAGCRARRRRGGDHQSR